MKRYALVAAVVLAAACSQSHGTGGSAADLQTAYCAYAARCDAHAFASLGGTAARCVETLANPDCGTGSARAFDLSAAQAHRCARALPAASCQHLRPHGDIPEDLCELVIAPVMGEGRSCLHALCSDGLFCDGSECPTCQPRHTQGAPCSQASDDECEAGLACIDSICQALGLLGEPCRSPRDCASDLCEEGVCSNGSGLVAAPCAEESDCRDSLDCVDGRCVGAASACEPMPGRCDCPEGQACGLESIVCEAYLPPGAPCTFGGAFCEVGYACGAQGVCVSWPREGENCRDKQRCVEGTYCDRWVTGLCTKLEPEGAACEYDFECAGDSCFRGRCGPRRCPP